MAGDKFSGGLDAIVIEGAKQLGRNLQSIVAGIGELGGKLFGSEGHEAAATEGQGHGTGFMGRMMEAMGITANGLDAKQPIAPVREPEIAMTAAPARASVHDCDHNDIQVPNVPNMRSGGQGMTMV